MPITELRIEGLRTIEKVRLGLDGLTVLIGDNGTGKSSILEACEILRRATGPRFLDELYGIHGGLPALLRQGAQHLLVGVTIRPTAEEVRNRRAANDVVKTCELLRYELALVPSGAFAAVHERALAKLTPEGVRVAGPKRRGARKNRGKSDGEGFELVYEQSDSERVFFAERANWYTSAEPEGKRLLVSELHASSGMTYGDFAWSAVAVIGDYLAGLDLHLPFETLPSWAARALDRKSALRGSALLTPADQLEKLGLNLASSYHALKNNFGRAQWDRTLEYIRLGLGERIEDVVTWADPGGGNIGLSIKLVGLDRPIPAAQLSDGMLSYLAFVALFRLHTVKPSLVAFDEPDLHLHPQLLGRVLDMFLAMAAEHPVLLATHSDRLLDALPDPARSVVLCELDEHGATRLLRPDAEALGKWLERYRGLGDIRAAGHAASVLTKVQPA